MELAATSNVVIAAIGAGGAVLGAIVGGLTTYTIERSREKTQRENERKAEDRVMHGIARVWSKKLGDFYVLVDDHSPPQMGSSWWKNENDVNPEIDVEDKKRVAAAASPQQWRAIDYALTHVREARAARDNALQVASYKGIGDPPPISKKDVHTLRRAMKKVEHAIEGLAQLSNDTYPPKWLKRRINKSKNVSERSDAEGDGALEVVKYLWPEYSYRHDMAWRLVFRITAVATALIIAPFLINVRTQQILAWWLIFLPVLAVAVILAGCYALRPELNLLNKVRDAYRCEQDRALHNVPGWTPRQSSSHEFDKRVWTFMAVIFVAAITYLILFVVFWLPYLAKAK